MQSVCCLKQRISVDVRVQGPKSTKSGKKKAEVKQRTAGLYLRCAKRAHDEKCALYCFDRQMAIKAL